MPNTYSRADVETHYGDSRPAVNVKVHDSLADGFRAFAKYDPDHDPAFDEAWVDRHVSPESVDALFWLVCSDGWGMIEDDAREIFGAHVAVESDGRSGGWAVVRGLPEVGDWDAVQLAKWRKFERWAKLQASDVMYRVVSMLYYNDYLAWKARGRGLRRASMLAAV